MPHNKQLTIYTDGGARGNPGPAAIGVVIYDAKGKIIDRIGRYIGETTNNQAEYSALITALAKAAELQAREVKCFLDSELVVKQLSGEYKVKEQGLQSRVKEVLRLSNKFESVVFRHVSREENRLADKLVNLALDKAAA
ncbi:MAG: ribonuclease HI family protein [Candidatus Doudnabacteria bacterium]|nr:ribonuclease HI family protein [Candidatus Doudnabacteria bacterium]